GADNFVSLIPFYKTTGQSSTILPQKKDYLLWYARNLDALKFRQLYLDKSIDYAIDGAYDWLQSPAGERRPMTASDRRTIQSLVDGGWRVCALSGITSSGELQIRERVFSFRGRDWLPPRGSHWKTTVDGLEKLKIADRVDVKGNSLRY